jgi:hypothetical protein
VSGARHRRKGDRIEREIVDRHKALGIRAERYPLSGASRFRGSGHDVDVYALGPDEGPLVGEVKARKSGGGFVQLEKWLGEYDLLFLPLSPSQQCRSARRPAVARLGAVAQAGAPMSERRRLDNRRANSTFELECSGLKYVCTVGRFADGSIGEVFLTNSKPSSQSDVNARDAAVAASSAFQFGCPLDVLRRALLRDPHGKASSPLGAALYAIAEVVAP